MGLWGWIASLGATFIAVLIAWPVLPEKGFARAVFVGFIGAILICSNLLLKFHTGEDFFDHVSSFFGPFTCSYITSKKCVTTAQPFNPPSSEPARPPGLAAAHKAESPPAQPVPPIVPVPPILQGVPAAAAPAPPPTQALTPPAALAPPPVMQNRGSEYINLDGTVLSMLIPESAKFSFYDWLELVKKTPGIKWQDQLKMVDGPCNFLKKGTTRLALDGRPDISDRGTRLANWDIEACGPRSMVVSISFKRSIVDQNRTDDIGKGVLQSVRNTGATVQKIGCNLDMGRSEQVDYYSVKLAGKRRAIISTKLFCSAGGCDYSATIHLSDNEQEALKSDGRLKLTKTGC